MSKIRTLAFYLPQFHPIPENDKWWGKGFTEWTNVKKAKPLFRKHKQPKIPLDSKYYNLIDSETQVWQSELALKYGINGFCYWHYWFGNGKQLLEKPSNNMLLNKDVKIPFCFAWANETWSGRWHGLNEKILIKQQYLGLKDDTDHFYKLLPFFKDERYIKKEGKPLFLILNQNEHPYLKEFINLWNSLSYREGMPGFYFIGIHTNATEPDFNILDASIKQENYFYQKRFGLIDQILLRITGGKILSQKISSLRNGCTKLSYPFMVRNTSNERLKENQFPVILTGWDNTPRSGQRGIVLDNYNPDIFKRHVEKILHLVEHRTESFVFVKSWNEWAEGNYLEPDEEYKYSYLEALKNSL